MKKLIFAFLMIHLLTDGLVAQRQTNFWYFGVLAGIDFNSGSPVAVQGGQVNTNEGTAVMSDTAGNLLFYTDGIQVWNRNHQQMPGGSGLNGGISATQSALITPDPGNDSMYYIFTVDETGGPKGFCYSQVNMNLDSGRGDVTVKNILLVANVTEKLTAAYHGNNHDIWVVVHEWGSNSFYAYLLTNTGLSAPVVSQTGTIHHTGAIQNTYGQMKFNSCGNKLLVPIGYQDTVDIFDFDNLTGIVSNPQTLSFPDHVYGAEFSPDNSKIYISCYDPSATLLQFDLNAANIASSQVTISSTPSIYALQLAPDGKIYVVKSFDQFLGVISFPNLQGLACSYNDFGFDTDPGFMGIHPALGLPGFIASYFHPDFPTIQCNIPVAGLQSSDTTLCEKNCISFTDLTAGSVSDWQWLFPGAVPSSDTNQHPVNICYNNYGSYDVTLIVSNAAGTDTLFLPGFITVLPSPPIPSVAVYGDTLIAGSAASYQWYLNSTAINGATQQLYVTTQPGNYYVIISDSNGCQSASAIVTILAINQPPGANCFQSIISTGNQVVTIELKHCRTQTATFSVFNLLGEQIYRGEKKTVSNGILKETIPFRISSGVYLLSMVADDFTVNKKLLIYGQ